MIYNINFKIVLKSKQKEKKVNFVVVGAAGCVSPTLAVN
jgi:hypothetical protein